MSHGCLTAVPESNIGHSMPATFDENLESSFRSETEKIAPKKILVGHGSNAVFSIDYKCYILLRDQLVPEYETPRVADIASSSMTPRLKNG
jgi:hypothetical protein